MTKLWSTADVHPREQLAYWVHAIRANFDQLDCTPSRGGRFFGAIRSEAAGNVTVANVSSTAQIVTRARLRNGREFDAVLAWVQDRLLRLQP